MEIEKIGAITFLSYCAIWVIIGVASFVNRKVTKDIRKKITIDNVLGNINVVALIIAVNILFYLWKTPFIARILFTCIIIAFAIYGFKRSNATLRSKSESAPK